VLVGCWFSSLHFTRKMQRRFTREHRAVLVLDNVVERLSATSDVDQAAVRRALRLELSRSELGGRQSLSPLCEVRDGCLNVEILDGGGRPLARTRMKCGE